MSTIGTCRPMRRSSRSARHTSTPSMSGSRESTNTTSGAATSARSRVCRPEYARTTANPRGPSTVSSERAAHSCSTPTTTMGGREVTSTAGIGRDMAVRKVQRTQYSGQPFARCMRDYEKTPKRLLDRYLRWNNSGDVTDICSGRATLPLHFDHPAGPRASS